MTGFLDFIFGSGNSSGGKKYSKVKVKTRKGNSGSSVSVRNSATLVTGGSKGKHETVFSKASVDTRSGKKTHEQGWHGDKYEK